ncbi:DUF4136 domain-containing protein [Pseudoalteromonas sp. MMG012]|uniref:DUF4136 domain-containing protein n=1 Tax=Pseudoalteromonas sp. MMG012 TaxID=2822686 RepID=UPI001B3A484B|nr:DUF4136 domain-containing protein [Pseudoalteromonas sp. MMG012]MBQ4848850.1 DUF4136 domain-containing protein [Pseudoalteromonas sp. MMG012]
MLRNIILAASVILISACSNTPDWDYDKSVKFTNYKTFSWSADADLKNNGGNAYQINDLMEKRVRNAIIEAMLKHNIKLVESENADVLVNYHASVDSKIEADSFNTSYSARWNYWGFGYQTQTHAREYDVGTLVIDVIDKASNQLVWRGAKEGRLRNKQNPEQRTTSVNKTVFAILENFPPVEVH